MPSLLVCEIFKSIQGESTHAGRPCVFVRLSRCNLRCVYCDTRYAWAGGRSMTIEEVVKAVRRLSCDTVEITGGEPLLQAESIILMKRLLKEKYRVLLETNGSQDLKPVPAAVVKIMDIKTPGSGMHHHNLMGNIDRLRLHDEVKFVVHDMKDYVFARKIVRDYNLDKKCTVLFSGVHGGKIVRALADWILKDELNVRLNLQWHKIIWPKTRRGR